MIKEALERLINQLNLLDKESDTLILFDFSAHKIVVSQNPTTQIILDDFWVLIETKKMKGRKIEVISSNKLKAMIYELIKVLNNPKTLLLVPGDMSFSVHTYSEILLGVNLITAWNFLNEFDLRTNKLFKVILKLTNSRYRELYKSLNSISFS